ncbi:MAG: HEPN domain-containing protein [Candidatus Electrothrix sp. GW3-4]|uniref:HEPN domain-containing protein n=1 Tax=Candidatus Electrothrix sp. GW3-4 TaxID=3126740 RepID=UPI0030D13DAE
MKKQTEYWLNSAGDDLMLIQEIIGNEHLTNMVAFHSQQAIEKSIKAVLEEKEGTVPRIHNIINLQGKIENYIELSVDRELFGQINELYIDSRYPMDMGFLPDGKPSKEIAEEFFSIATEVYDNIRTYLS